jgi:hypothetical protein
VDSYPENVTIKWVYLESGHGKGAADGVGATVKSKLKMITARDGNVDFCAEELKKSYEEEQQNVRVIIYTAEDVDKVKRSSAYVNAPPKNGIGSCHEVLITKGKTTMKKRSGEPIFKTQTRNIGVSIPLSTSTPSRPPADVLVKTPQTDSKVGAGTAADSKPPPFPPKLELSNSYIQPSPSAAHAMNQSFSDLLNMDTKELFECAELSTRIPDYTWVVVKVPTSKKRVVHYVAQIEGFDDSSDEYLVQPYTLIADTKDYTFKELQTKNLERYDEDDIVLQLEKPQMIPRNKVWFEVIPGMSNLCMQ